MSDLFQNSVDQIDAFYHAHNYKLGWRFLSCPKSVLLNNPKIALITLNPGGREIPSDHPWGSSEVGNAYVHESWGKSPPGKSNLQIQIRRLFKQLALKLETEASAVDLLERTLCGHFVPFRSPRLADLEYKQEALRFAETIWSPILIAVRPKLFICIDRETYKRLVQLVSHTYGLTVEDVQSLETGWGSYTADIVCFGESAEIKLLRLPHLSTFKLFTSDKCTEYINRILSIFCSNCISR